jgi:hypothetical protein
LASFRPDRFTPFLPLKTFRQALAFPGIWAFVLVGAAAFIQLLSPFVRGYAPEYGITKFLVIGREFDARGLAVFRSTPKYIGPSDRWGFDGQFYAELALDPLLRDPQLKIALDAPAYRSRRILTSWLAWLGGFGRPFWILNVYAGLNLVFWTGFAVMMARLFRPYGWAGLAGFAAMLITCGIIESLRSSLTDFPGFVLVTLSMMIGRAGGAGVLALAALTREPNLLGIVGLWDYRPPWRATIKRNVQYGVIVGLPLALWIAYVMSRFPVENSITGDNLTWPFRGIMGKLGEFSVHAANGDIAWRTWYSEFLTSEPLHALLTIIATLTQSVYLFTHREWNNRIWRVGAIFVPYFLCISSIPWESHFTITRHALPITLAFNLVLAMRGRRGWLVWFVLGNCFVPYGVYQFANYGWGTAGAPVEYHVVSTKPSTPTLQVRFGQGWSAEEWTWKHTWRWSVAKHASLNLSNPTAQPVEVSLSFTTKSISPRDLNVSVHGEELWSTRSLQSDLPAQTRRFLLPPGETVVDFDSFTPPAPSGSRHDNRRLSFRVKDLQIDLPAPPSDR